MREIELSIIIPVYNTEKYVERCLQSILKSDEAGIEIIVVDDGSTDASLEICQKIAVEDSRLQVYSKKNGGVSSARNLGLDKAKGRYVTFCDADDYYEDGAVPRLVTELKSSDNDLLFFPFYLEPMNSSKKVFCVSEFTETRQVSLTYLKDNFWKLLNEGMINASWNRVFQRKQIEKVGLRFREDMTFSEDGLFNVMYLRSLDDVSKIIYLAEPIYNYVSNEGQATRKKVNQYFYMMCLAFDNIDKFLGEERKNSGYWKEWLSVIRDTIYHQNYILDNANEILSNRRTREMLERYHPRAFQDKLMLRNMKNREMQQICNYFKRKNQIRCALRRILKGSRR